MQNNNVYEYINITNVLNQLHIKKTGVRGNYIYAIYIAKIIFSIISKKI